MGEDLPEPLRSRAVTHLRGVMSDSLKAHARELIAKDPREWWVSYHFSTGMWVRNQLRTVIPDTELPEHPAADGTMSRNWDDWYVSVLEEACREV